MYRPCDELAAIRNIEVDLKKVAVIVLNWNGLKDTIECLNSVLKSSWDDHRIYMVDNDSRENEGDLIASMYAGVKVLQQQENQGFCGGNNIAIREALREGAEYILLLNNDTVVPADMIRVLVEGFEKLPDAGAVSPLILDLSDQHQRVQFSGARWIRNRASFTLLAAGNDYKSLLLQQPYETEFACGCCLLTHASVIEKAGLLDERYFAYYDEADWCRRLTRHGYKSYMIPQTAVYHSVLRSNTLSHVALYLLSRNRLLWIRENLSFTEKIVSWKPVIKEGLWHSFNSFGWKRKAIYTKRESKAFLRGYKDFFRGRFGRWEGKTERLLFGPDINRKNKKSIE